MVIVVYRYRNALYNLKTNYVMSPKVLENNDFCTKPKGGFSARVVGGKESFFMTREEDLHHVYTCTNIKKTHNKINTAHYYLSLMKFCQVPMAI